MRGTMIPGLLALGALFLAAGSARAESKAGPQKPRYEIHNHETGKEDPAVLDTEDPKSVEKFLDSLRKDEVGEIELDKPPSFLNIKWDLGLWSLVVFLGLLF